MKAYVTNPTSVLGASLTGALSWEGHTMSASISEADVVFETSHGVIYRKDRGLARFLFGELLGPGDVTGTCVGDWLHEYIAHGRASHRPGGAYITDGRDVALAMIEAAERGLSGDFDVVGPFYTFDELADVLGGAKPSRPNIALPELGVSFRPIEETLEDAIAYLKPVAGSRAASMVA